MNDKDTKTINSRRAERKFQDEILSIKLISPPEEFSYMGESIYCSTINISSTGLQIGLDTEIPENWRTEIWIVTNTGKTIFNLKGSIIWVKEYEGQEEFTHCAGIDLEDTQDTHFQAWQDMFEQITM